MRDSVFGPWPETIAEMSRSDSVLWVRDGPGAETVCVGFGSPSFATASASVTCTCGARERAIGEAIGALTVKLRGAVDMLAEV